MVRCPEAHPEFLDIENRNFWWQPEGVVDPTRCALEAAQHPALYRPQSGITRSKALFMVCTPKFVKDIKCCELYKVFHSASISTKTYFSENCMEWSWSFRQEAIVFDKKFESTPCCFTAFPKQPIATILTAPKMAVMGRILILANK